jgi:hypothetical protein
MAACDTSGPSLLGWLLDALIGEAEREGEEEEAIRHLIKRTTANTLNN